MFWACCRCPLLPLTRTFTAAAGVQPAASRLWTIWVICPVTFTPASARRLPLPSVTSYCMQLKASTAAAIPLDSAGRALLLATYNHGTHTCRLEPYLQTDSRAGCPLRSPSPVGFPPPPSHLTATTQLTPSSQLRHLYRYVRILRRRSLQTQTYAKRRQASKALDRSVG
jgi:hypothetical protein